MTCRQKLYRFSEVRDERYRQPVVLCSALSQSRKRGSPAGRGASQKNAGSPMPDPRYCCRCSRIHCAQPRLSWRARLPRCSRPAAARALAAGNPARRNSRPHHSLIRRALAGCSAVQFRPERQTDRHNTVRGEGQTSCQPSPTRICSTFKQYPVLFVHCLE